MPIERKDHLFQGKQLFFNRDTGGFQAIIVPLQVAVSDQYSLGYVRTQIMGAAACITFSEREVAIVDGPAVLTQKDIGLERMGTMVEIDRQDIERRLEDDGRARPMPFDQVGYP
ncbi:hypothetical protein DESC_290133 [Desulfosarcina cetonica]|nr:hypothetical protein DESC_290133 [Desulfosarcina cetonica]